MRVGYKGGKKGKGKGKGKAVKQLAAAGHRGNGALPPPRNKTKAKIAAERDAEASAAKIASALGARGWAVCDGVACDELVRAVRSEMRGVEAGFKQSEIWLGKEADVGAQIAVPNVRGDKVRSLEGG